MAEVMGPRGYTRGELELVALLAAEQATVGALPPRGRGSLLVTAEAHAAAEVTLAAFDAHRAAAAGYTAEELSGTRMGYPRSDELDAGGPHG